VVSLEILTVLGVGPLCCYILKQLLKDDPARHYWIIVLSTAEVYGGCVPLASGTFDLFTSLLSLFRWMTFCPEWLTGSPNLNTSNALYLWVYLVVCPGISFPSLVLTKAIPSCFFLKVNERNVRQTSLVYWMPTDKNWCRWAVIPLWMMYNSYSHIAGSLRAAQAAAKAKSD
jgi:hypothetical protein